MTLVLDTSDNTLGPPVNRGGESGYVDLERRLGDGDVNVLQTLEKAVEFLVGEISELVEANSESDISTRVELSDPVVVILPDGVPGLEFIGRINLVVFPHPFGEARLEVLLVAQSGTYEEGEEEESDERAHLMSVSVCGVQKTKTEVAAGKALRSELISRSVAIGAEEGRQNRSVRVRLTTTTFVQGWRNLLPRFRHLPFCIRPDVRTAKYAVQIPFFLWPSKGKAFLVTTEIFLVKTDDT